MREEIIYKLQDLKDVAKKINNKLSKLPLLTLQGPLGAGKTTMVKAILKSLGINIDEVTSPTFTYINVYNSLDGKRIYHFDLYRIKNETQFKEMGFDEYLDDKNAIILIEWPEIIKNILSNYLDAKIDYEDSTKRKLTLETKL